MRRSDETQREIKYCPRTGKICYSSSQAKRVIHAAHKRKRHGIKHIGKVIPQRIYFCKICGYFHTTSCKSKEVHGRFK